MPRRVFVNLADHLARGEEITVTTTKAAGKGGTRRANWSVQGRPGNLGTGSATLVTASPAVEEQPVVALRRTFKNRVKLPFVGGDEFAVTAKKVHSVLTLSNPRVLPEVELVAWRRLYFTVNFMDGFGDWAESLARDLPALMVPAFIELLPRNPGDRQAMRSVAHVDSAGVRGLVGELPDEVYGRRLPAAAERPHWLRLVLVRKVLGKHQGAVREVVAEDCVVAGAARRITKLAPMNWLYAAPHPVEKLELVLTQTFPVVGGVHPTSTLRKGGDGPVTTFQVEVDQEDVAAAVRLVVGVKSHVFLCVEWEDGGTDRKAAESFADPLVTFSWTNGNVSAVKMKKRWEGTPRTKHVEVQTRYEITLPPDGQAAEAQVTVSDDASRFVIEVTDPTWVARLDDFFAGRLGPGVLKVHGKVSHSIAGQSSNANIAIALEEVVARAGNEPAARQMLLRVMLHEIIHAIGGVPKTMSDGTEHPKFYPELFGGGASATVAHCSYNTVLTDADALLRHDDEQMRKTYEPNKPRIYAPASPSICVMYHRAYTPHFATATLCPDCVRALRLIDLSATSSPLAADY